VMSALTARMSVAIEPQSRRCMQQHIIRQPERSDNEGQ
jgi:hypothetical protein